MKKTLPGIVAGLLVVCFAAVASAAKVGGHFRSNGAYVAPHYRSTPDSMKWNNYGPSKGRGGFSSPFIRDNDRDGIPNLRDRDDNNNFIHDNHDSKQYKLR